MGKYLAATAGRVATHPEVLGILAMSMLERTWAYAQLYDEKLSRQVLIDQSADALRGLARIQAASPLSDASSAAGD